MGRNKLCAGGILQKLRFAITLGCLQGLQYEITLGHGAGFIHNHGLNMLQSLHSHATLEQDAILGASADTTEKGQGYAEHQSAGTADDEEGQRCIDPFLPIPCKQGGNHSHRHCRSYYKGSVNTGKASNETVDGWLGGSGIFYAVQNSRYHGLGQHLLHANFEHATCIHAARDDFIAKSTLHRHGLACNRGSVHETLAFNNHTI